MLNVAAINAIITLNKKALDEARQLDAERKSGKVRGPLHGIPVVLKDNYDTVDMPTTAGSQLLEGHRAKQDAFMVKKLRDAFGFDIEIAIEFHAQWNVTSAIRIARALEPFGPMWLEDMLMPGNFHQYHELAAATSLPYSLVSHSTANATMAFSPCAERSRPNEPATSMWHAPRPRRGGRKSGWPARRWTWTMSGHGSRSSNR